jgi:Xaa-Pro dipeptidase
MAQVRQASLAQPIEPREYRERRERLLRSEAAAGVDGMVWWASHRVQYLSGFAFVPTERPIGMVITGDGESMLFVPRLEVEHAEAYAHVDRVVSYPEYPDRVHPMRLLADELQALGLGRAGARFGGDGDGYPKVMGYRGPRVTELTGADFEPLDDVLETMMQVKSPAEIALIRESARWAGRAHELLQERTAVGRGETEVEAEVAALANAELLAAYAGTYRPLSWGRSGPHAGYRGQIGAHSALPHSLTINAVFQPGDTLVTGATCPMFGYWSELERTMVIGEPSRAQRDAFAHMLALQDLAIDACRPGRSCASVDEAVRSYVHEHGLADAWRHHVGHNIGLRYHEGPFLDVGDETEMQPGMLFTVEPGLYLPGLGGFRHSDTILVTDGAPEFLTDYPRAFERLILPTA